MDQIPFVPETSQQPYPRQVNQQPHYIIPHRLDRNGIVHLPHQEKSEPHRYQNEDQVTNRSGNPMNEEGVSFQVNDCLIAFRNILRTPKKRLVAVRGIEPRSRG